MYPTNSQYQMAYPSGMDVWDNQSYLYNNINMAQHPYQPQLPMYQSYPSLSSAVVTLGNEEEWKKFEGKMNEMIVNKMGRSLFPLLNFTIDNIDENGVYTFGITMERIDNKKYRYKNGKWTETTNTDIVTQANSKQVRHSDGFKNGREWMDGNVSFDKLKITNNYAEVATDSMDEKSKMRMVLKTMVKYKPVLSLIQKFGDIEQVIQQIPFDNCEFITVTGYQNQEISKLKVENNKYARKRERKVEEDYENDENKKEVKRMKVDIGYTMMDQQSFGNVSQNQAVPDSYPYYPTPPPSTSPPVHPFPQYQNQPSVGMPYNPPTYVDHSMYNPNPSSYQSFGMYPQYGNGNPSNFQ